MNDHDPLETARDLLAGWTTQANTPEPMRLDVEIDASSLVAAVTAMMDAHWGYLAGITGLDLGVETAALEVLYHFCDKAYVLTMRVRIPRDGAHVPTISGVIPSAGLYERELREMFGVTVDGLRGAEFLFLPDDWQEGVYPLRKDARLE